MGNSLAYTDAISYFQMAGIMFAGLVVVSVCFSTSAFLISRIPFIGAIFLFGLVLMFLFLGMGFFFLTEHWNWSDQAQLYVKYAYFGIVFIFVLIVYVWAHRPKY